MHFISFEAPVLHEDRIVGREPPPGYDLASSILRNVQQAGLPIIESLGQHDSYGWSFVVGMGATRVLCILQLSDEWLLITHTSVSLLDRLRGRAGTPADYTQVDAALLEALSAIPHVANVRWFRSEADLREGRPGQP